LPSQKFPDGAFGVPCSPQFCSCQRALKVFPPQRPHVPFRDFRFDRFRRRISRPTVNTHFRRRPITGIRRGFWGEPAGSPRVSNPTRRFCHELCLLQVFRDRSAHGKTDTCNRPFALQRTWRKWDASASSRHLPGGNCFQFQSAPGFTAVDAFKCKPTADPTASYRADA